MDGYFGAWLCALSPLTKAQDVLEEEGKDNQEDAMTIWGGLARVGVPLLWAMAVVSPALAQQPVPLSEALLEQNWVVVDFPGRTEAVGVDGPVTFQRDGSSRIIGRTPCGDGWNGKLVVNLPAISISDVESFYTNDCPLMRETVSFLDHMELVRSARTGPDGLELLSEKGERLFLLVAGG